jgi:eukaryotic-like serine/threonine-protein kinase
MEYLVEELVEGESLREVLRRGPLSLAEFRRLAGQIADGLAAAHRAGIIHCDLKPGNIMVSHEGSARILDFGLATSHRAESEEATASLTLLGEIAGTAAYMSPEQVQGNRVDSRSDIFSYGALLYERISGRRAFVCDNVTATLVAVLKDEPPPVAEIVAGVPRKLAGIIQKCLEKDPNLRFQKIEEVKTAIDDLENEAKPAVPVRRQSRRRLQVVGAGAAAVVIGLALGGWFFYSRRAQVLTNKDTIVLADFANSTGDSVFDDALKQALAVQLGQSPLINVLAEQKVRAALTEMMRSSDEALTASTAQEVCERIELRLHSTDPFANRTDT